MQIKARAKINWALEITGQRPDGYHLLDGVMQPLALSDTLTMEESPALSLTIEGSTLSAGEDNLILRAARALGAHAGVTAGARMHLVKRIPMGAGLGGGSADAAAALKGLNAFWQLNLPMETLLQIGVTLGADVPFCLMDAPMRAQGIGEILSPVSCKRTFPLVLIQPCEGLSTKEIFTAYHQKTPKGGNVAEVVSALAEGDLSRMERHAVNMLETVSAEKKPILKTAIRHLYEQGAAFARMTGSGSVVFGAFEDDAAADAAFDVLSKQYPTCIRTETAL